MESPTTCSTEPWGRYSASGGLYQVNGSDYFYSFGGDTGSDADGRGGVVRTCFRYSFETGCWERLLNSPTHIGYRATATSVSNDPDNVYILFGADRNRAGTNDFYRYSLSQDSWTQLNTTVAVPFNTTTEVPPPRWKHAAVALDDTRILVTGGRDGAAVHTDAWIFDTADLSWTLLNATGLPAMYRHGLAWDATRNVVWIHGGLDGSLTRYQGQLWQLNMTNNKVTQVDVSTNVNPLPPLMASFAMEYVSELDVLLLWGGTCSDDSELHIYDPEDNSWCRIFPGRRPDRRDAMLWALDYPNFYITQGDSICYNRQVLTIADVHRLDLQALQNWEMIYEPTNMPRGTGEEPYCDGSNAGNCQPTPLFEDTSSRAGTCSFDLLAKFFNTTIVEDGKNVNASNSSAFSTMDPTTTLAPTPSAPASPTEVNVVASKAGSSDQKDTIPSPVASSQAFTCSPCLPLAWMLLMVLKQVVWS